MWLGYLGETMLIVKFVVLSGRMVIITLRRCMQRQVTRCILCHRGGEQAHPEVKDPYTDEESQKQEGEPPYATEFESHRLT